ncbi:MAG: OmpH family outer membrane protein [Gammaproteobacteria bacterium]|jgi:outer membrane protein|nr:OmpH family outer membrane protein [Gammaproteobacteria bacterium]
MTKRLFTYAFVALWALFAIVSSATAEEVKIGVVNAAKVLEEAPQMETARKILEKEFAPRDQELVELQKSVRNLEEKLTRDGDIMSDVERRNMERDIRSRTRELKRLQDEFNEDLNLKRNEAFDRIRRKVLEVVNVIGKKEKFDLIVNDGVLYASERIDITSTVIKQLKNEAGAAASGKK